MSIVSKVAITVEQGIVTKYGAIEGTRFAKAAERAIRASQKKSGLVVDNLAISVKETWPAVCYGSKSRTPKITFAASGQTKTPAGIWGHTKKWFGEITTNPLLKAKITVEEIVNALRELRPPA